MIDYHGIIFAYSARPGLRELVLSRTGASVPFCGRYRLIDFALSSMRNAGIRDVGVIMQRDYQSLLDHISNAKSWDMNRKIGGLKLLPPFGLPEYHKGNYTGTIEALNAVSTYVDSIKQDYIVLMPGDSCVNLDLGDVLKQHEESGAEITAVCAEKITGAARYRYVPDSDNRYAEKLLLSQTEGDDAGYPSLEIYVISKQLLQDMMDICRSENLYSFHRDGLQVMLREGYKINLYIHKGYAACIDTVESFFAASLDMLESENRHSIFPAGRPVRTFGIEGVSTYYGEKSRSVKSLVADDCIIEGSIESCIIHAGVRIAEGAQLRNCILMRGTVIEAGVKLENVITDKYCKISSGTELKGSKRLPLVVPKGSIV